jgi:hypothetical protein
MNERIKELAVEAGIISAEYNGFDPTGLTKAQRKFAELIVRECIDIVEKDLVVNLTKAKTDNEGKIWTNAQLTFSQMIKWRFGVSE